MEDLTEEKVCQLAMSPLYVLHFVVSESLAPQQVTERHVVRAVEYGLQGESRFSEEVFELLRSHLHEFYAEFPVCGACRATFIETLRTELQTVRELLDQVPVPAAMVDDFKAALTRLAGFVAAGKAFRQELDDPGMRDRAAWVGTLFT